MSGSYYARESTTHVDGTAIFQTHADRAGEQEVAQRLSSAWNCTLHRFGALCPIDWYAERHARLVGLVELKARPHASTRYPSVYLNTRKWLALTLGSLGLGCPAIFVVQLTDGLFWVPLSRIQPGLVRVAGCMTIVKSRSDIEPIIEVPVAGLRKLAP